MNQIQIGKVWGVVGLFLLYYALNAWIVSQGGQELFEAKMLAKGKAPVALIAIPICSVLLILVALVGRLFARRSGAASWHSRLPIAFFESLDTGKVEGSLYQGAMLAFFEILPAISLFHFWSVILAARVVTTDDPPRAVAGIWDWSHFGWNDPARICTTYRENPVACGLNSTLLPGLEPSVFAVLTVCAAGALLAHITAVFFPGRKKPEGEGDRLTTP